MQKQPAAVDIQCGWEVSGETVGAPNQVYRYDNDEWVVAANAAMARIRQVCDVLYPKDSACYGRSVIRFWASSNLQDADFALPFFLHGELITTVYLRRYVMEQLPLIKEFA